MDKYAKLNESLKDNNIDGILISNSANIFYFSGFTGTSAKLLICEEARYLITDFRYAAQAKNNDLNFEVLIEDKEHTLYNIVNQLRRKHKLNVLALEGDYISRNQWLAYEKHLTSRLVDFNVDFIREIKAADEIKTIKKAIEIAELAFEEILPLIKVGVSEKSLALKLEYKMLELGAEAIAFNTIVASGKRGALPHGVASDKLIENNELITFDYGCVYNGYCSDITRTVAIGKPDNRLIEIYDIVLAANKLGIESLKANILGSEVDKIVRDFIDSTKYKGLFGHGLGHSIGIDIHENPRLRNDVDQMLKVNNVVTIEPGIYVDGLGGVRIEDDVLILADKVEVLTSLNKELIYLEGED